MITREVGWHGFSHTAGRQDSWIALSCLVPDSVFLLMQGAFEPEGDCNSVAFGDHQGKLASTEGDLICRRNQFKETKQNMLVQMRDWAAA